MFSKETFLVRPMKNRQQILTYLKSFKMRKLNIRSKILLSLSVFALILVQSSTPIFAKSAETTDLTFQGGTAISSVNDEQSSALAAESYLSTEQNQQSDIDSISASSDHGEMMLANSAGGGSNHGHMVMASNGPNPEALTNRYVNSGNQIYGERPLKTTQGRKIKKGLFKVFCKASHFNYDDPLVFNASSNPTRNATHLHMFWGNPRANYAMTRAVQMQSPSSSCNGGTKNLSAYWVPAVLDKNNNPQIPDHFHNYYKDGEIRGGKKDRNQNINDFSKLSKVMHNPMPDGLRMLIGNAEATSLQSQKALRLECSNGGKGEAVANFKDAAKRCKSGGRLQITMVFPQCWNGKNLDSANHISHMAYPVRRKCPSSHPYPVPRLSYQLRFNKLTNAELQSMPGWHLSSDGYNWASKGGGYSLHAAFIEGWKPAAKRDFIRNCLRETRFCDN